MVIQPDRTGAEALGAVLMSSGRAPGISESADAYGWLVGSWDLEVLRYWGRDVSAQHLSCEVHASWILEGRAIQDVWIMPSLGGRTDLDKQLNMYGTTLRVWDPTIQGWRITWRNPAGDHHEEQIGRWSGRDVVQIGVRGDGTPTRWTFTEITQQSFHWLGEALGPDGKTWNREGEFRARRRNGMAAGPAPTAGTRKASAVSFLELVASGQVREAYQRHVAGNFRHHNPSFRGDATALRIGMEENARRNPHKLLEIQRALEDGDLVAVHSRVRLKPAEPGLALVHPFRFEGERIAELWDLGQPVPENSPNENAMF